MTCNHCGGRNLKNIQAIRAHLRHCPTRPDVPVSHSEPMGYVPEPRVVPSRPVPLVQRASQGHRVKIQHRPVVFEIDESLVFLHHHVLDSAQNMGVNYRAALGEWIRDSVFQFYYEHPEVIALSTLLTPLEAKEIPRDKGW